MGMRASGRSFLTANVSGAIGRSRLGISHRNNGAKTDNNANH
jgi:hypothetical protein